MRVTVYTQALKVEMAAVDFNNIAELSEAIAFLRWIEEWWQQRIDEHLNRQLSPKGKTK